MHINKRLLIANFIIVINVVAGKVFFNDGSATSSTVNSSFAAYVIAIVFLGTYGYIFLILNKRFIPNNSLLITAFLYYIWMLVWSLNSNIPLMSFYYSVSGILMLFFSIYYNNSISCLTRYDRYKEIHKTMFYVFISYTLSAMFFQVYYLKKSLMLGLPLGFAALLYYYFVFIQTKNAIDNNRLISFFWVVFLVFLGIYFQSFSAFLSYFICVVFYIFLKKRYVLISIFTSLLVLLSLSFIRFLLNNEGTNASIAGKSVNSILIGSGRFSVYEKAIEAYSELGYILKIIGIGFMTERSALQKYDLAWSIDVHSSFLLSLLTGGAGGGLLYLIFITLPYLSKNKKSSLYNNFLIFHTMCVTYGFTSSYYLGRPSYLLLLSLLFSFVFLGSNKLLNKNQC